MKWVRFPASEIFFQKIFFNFELDFLKSGFFVQALVNKEGFDPDNNAYSYEFEFEESSDGDGEYTYPEGLSSEEEAKLEELIETENLEKAGWIYEGNE